MKIIQIVLRNTTFFLRDSLPFQKEKYIKETSSGISGEHFTRILVILINCRKMNFVFKRKQKYVAKLISR